MKFFGLFGHFYIFVCCRSIPDMYKEKLIEENVLSKENVENIIKTHTEFLANELASWDSYEPEASYFNSQWKGFQQASSEVTSWDTGIDYSLLSFIGRKSVSFPQDFVNTKILSLIIRFY